MKWINKTFLAAWTFAMLVWQPTIAEWNINENNNTNKTKYNVDKIIWEIHWQIIDTCEEKFWTKWNCQALYSKSCVKKFKNLMLNEKITNTTILECIWKNWEKIKFIFWWWNI